jgi:hypothetical protein
MSGDECQVCGIYTTGSVCAPCRAGDSTELGTRNGNKELGTRRTSTPLLQDLVPSSPELGSSSTPSSHVDSVKVRVLVEDVRQLRDERIANPPKAGDPAIVPYSLSFAVKRGKARDKNEAKRLVDAALKSNALRYEYELKPRRKAYGTRCYSLPDRQAA